MAKLSDQTVWLDRRTVATHATVDVDGDTVTVSSPSGMTWTYEIVEQVRELMAWDVDRDGRRVRLVAQDDCGCGGGPKRYRPDETYSGALPVR